MKRSRNEYLAYDIKGHDDNKRRKLSPMPLNEQSVFALPELVEKIISYLFKASETIMAISYVSKR